MVSQLILHLAEKDAPGVHVRLRERAGQQISLVAIWQPTPKTEAAYYRSPFDGSLPLFKMDRMAVPSIMLAAEFPKNLLLGLRVPSTLIL